MPNPGAPGVDQAILDRRDSPRVPMRFWARARGEEAWTAYDGDLSVGGVFLKASGAPPGSRMEIKLRLPAEPAEVVVQGELIGHGAKGDVGAHVRFVDTPVEAELAIARYLDGIR